MKASSRWRSPYSRRKRERVQSADQSRGFIEHKKDYKVRAARARVKREFIEELERQAEGRNPEEFAFGMIGDVRRRDEPKQFTFRKLTKQQERLVSGRSIVYIRTKLYGCRERLNAMLMLQGARGDCTRRIVGSASEAAAVAAEYEGCGYAPAGSEELSAEIAAQQKEVRALEHALAEAELRVAMKSKTPPVLSQDEESGDCWVYSTRRKT